MNLERLLERIVDRHHRNVDFADFTRLVEAFGFRLHHIRGSHHIYLHPAVREPLALQPMGGEAKPYQIRQFLDAVERYNLKSGDRP